MRHAVLRVVVDTNVWVSSLVNRLGAPARVRAALAARKFTLLLSEPLLTELAEVAMRPRIAQKYKLTQEDIAELIGLLRSRAEHVTVTGELWLCRDPDDDMVIETTLRGRADALVTRDDDLKGAAEVAEHLGKAGIAVMSVRRFLELLDRPTPDQ